jgi:hypothetical protein
MSENKTPNLNWSGPVLAAIREEIQRQIDLALLHVAEEFVSALSDIHVCEECENIHELIAEAFRNSVNKTIKNESHG